MAVMMTWRSNQTDGFITTMFFRSLLSAPIFEETAVKKREVEICQTEELQLLQINKIWPRNMRQHKLLLVEISVKMQMQKTRIMLV